MRAKDKSVRFKGARSLLAPAKLNIYLKVTGRRADGYHLLDMINIPIDLCDTVSLSPLETGGHSIVTIKNEDIAPFPPALRGELEDPARNLAARAVDEVFKLCKNKSLFSLDIVKRIPIGAGLGGGSSDAAAALKLALVTCGQNIDPSSLAALALQLGADVPFFLAATSARVSGIGEVVQPFELTGLSGYTAALFIPSYGICTAAVYNSLRASSISKLNEGEISGRRVGESNEEGKVSIDDLAAKNDLEPHAVGLEPRLGLLLRDIRDVCARFSVHLAGMTGSGSVCFALLSKVQCAEISQSFKDLAGRHNAALKFCKAGVFSPMTT